MAEPRRFSAEYLGRRLDDDAFDALHDAVVDLFATHGLTVEGCSDGPCAPEATYTTTVTPTGVIHMDDKVYTLDRDKLLGAAYRMRDALRPAED